MWFNLEKKTGTSIEQRAERRRAKSRQINRNAAAMTKLIQAGSLPWRSCDVGWRHGSGDPAQSHDTSRTAQYDLSFRSSTAEKRLPAAVVISLNSRQHNNSVVLITSIIRTFYRSKGLSLLISLAVMSSPSSRPDRSAQRRRPHPRRPHPLCMLPFMLLRDACSCCKGPHRGYGRWGR